jgi:inorganic pyrophosphatase
MIDVCDSGFWNDLNVLLKNHKIVIDRSKGTTHSRYPDFRYPLDYGYLDGTSGGDGQGIDVWVGSGSRSCLTGVVCTVDLHKRDAEVKLLLGCTIHEAETVLGVHNSGPQAAILILNPACKSPSTECASPGTRDGTAL